MIKKATKSKQNSISPARQVAYEVLQRVEKDGAYAHLAWQEARSRLSPLDAGLAQEVIFGVLIWKRLLDTWIQSLSKNPLTRIQLEVMLVLRLALFQLRFLSRVPAYAVLNDAVEQVKKLHKSAAPFVNGVLRAALREEKYVTPILNEQECIGLRNNELGIRLSFPDWLVEMLVERFGDKAGAIMLALNQKPTRAVRINAKKGTRAELIERLQKEGIEATPSPISPFGIRLAQGVQPLQLEAYKEGYISLQGESSMLVAPLFGNLQGKKFLDACAAPGGKGLHVAELASDQFDATLAELHESRARFIKAQARRLGIESAKVVVGDSREVGGDFDAVLLDAPCSGLGTIARKPDIKWRMKPEDMATLAVVQSELLDAMAKRVQPSGTLIYTTCTLSEKENEAQVNEFLLRHPHFRLLPIRELDEVALTMDAFNRETGLVYIMPQDFHGDGFFLARMVRRGD